MKIHSSTTAIAPRRNGRRDGALHVVLLGSGYLSCWTYRYLMRFAGSRVRKGDIRITCITDSGEHNFHGFSGEFLSGALSMEYYSNPITRLMPEADILKARVQGVDPDSKSVRYRQADGTCGWMEYDQLVVGIGTHCSDRDIPGLREHGTFVKGSSSMEAAIERISDIVRQAGRCRTVEEKQKVLQFAIVGGGVMGAEIAGAVVEALRRLDSLCPGAADLAEVRWYTGGKVAEDLVPEYGDGASGRILRRNAHKMLAEQGVKVYLRSRLAAVEPGHLTLEDGRRFSFAMLIPAIGQQVRPPAGLVKMAAPDGRIMTDRALRVPQTEGVWAGGDVAAVPRPFLFGRTCPSDALWAIKHGTRIGKNLARIARGRRPMSFRFPGLGRTAAFGPGKAILALYGIPFSGRLASVLRAGFFAYYYPDLSRVIGLFRNLIHSNGDTAIQKPGSTVLVASKAGENRLSAA